MAVRVVVLHPRGALYMVSFFKTSEIYSYHLTTIAITLSRLIIFRGPMLLLSAAHCMFWAALYSKFLIVEQFQWHSLKTVNNTPDGNKTAFPNWE